MVPATIEDLESRWRALSPDERAIADVLLEDANARLDEMRPRTCNEPLLVAAQCEMVRNAMSHRTDAFAAPSQYDEGSEFSAYAAVGPLWLSTETKRVLGVAGHGVSRAGFASMVQPCR